MLSHSRAPLKPAIFLIGLSSAKARERLVSYGSACTAHPTTKNRPSGSGPGASTIKAKPSARSPHRLSAEQLAHLPDLLPMAFSETFVSRTSLA
jgi:hypothetical protein